MNWMNCMNCMDWMNWTNWMHWMNGMSWMNCMHWMNCIFSRILTSSFSLECRRVPPFLEHFFIFSLRILTCFLKCWHFCVSQDVWHFRFFLLRILFFLRWFIFLCVSCVFIILLLIVQRKFAFSLRFGPPFPSKCVPNATPISKNWPPGTLQQIYQKWAHLGLARP